jgi:hypothetical protein
MELKQKLSRLQYNIFSRDDGEVIPEFGNDRTADLAKNSMNELQFVDTWNHAGNRKCLLQLPFQNTLLRKRQ